jgi:hypothetical protein
MNVPVCGDLGISPLIQKELASFVLVGPDGILMANVRYQILGAMEWNAYIEDSPPHIDYVER